MLSSAKRFICGKIQSENRLLTAALGEFSKKEFISHVPAQKRNSSVMYLRKIMALPFLPEGVDSRRRQQLLESSQITSEPRGSKVGHGLPHPGPCTCSPFVPTTTSKVGTMDSTAEQQESQTCLSISCSSYFPERHV